MAIIQLTDIHIDATYGGKFPTIEHFNRAIQDIRKKRTEESLKEDVIIVTGDICDSGDRYYYDLVFDMLHNAFPYTPVFVTPGNHDDRGILEVIARAHEERNKALGFTFESHGRITLTGSYAVSFNYRNNKVLILDSGHMAKDGSQHFLTITRHEYLKEVMDDSLLFTHIPPFQVPHRFMQQDGYCMKHQNSMTSLIRDAKAIFCGHYHYAHVQRQDDFDLSGIPAPVDQYVCPAVQCQLDPYSAECSPSGIFPGYNLIHVNEDTGDVMVETRLLY